MGLATLADRLQLIDSLNRIYARLSTMVVNNHPQTAQEQQQQQQLLKARDQVGDLLDQFLSEGVPDIAEQLEGPTAALSNQADQLKNVADGMANAQSAIALVTQIIQTVAQIAALVAAA